MTRKIRAADLFCGAGGTSVGAEMTGQVDVVFALNHWDVAIQTHSANFPGTRHVNSRLEDTCPSECGKIDLLFASPSCTHHSRARGGKPTSDQQRAHANDVLKWLEHHRPSWFVLENVREFLDWGPVGNDGRPLKSLKGKLFEAWLMSVKGCGYTVDHRILNAADFGAATSRERLFVVARKGNRYPVWPEPTHCENPGGELPGMGLPRWRPAYEVIDWSLPCPSIFGRKRPLADKTLLRIEAGLRRFVGPFVSSYHGGGDGSRRNYSLTNSLPTQDTSNRYGLAMPFISEFNGGADRRNRSPGEPLGTVMAGATRFGLSVPYLVPFFGERPGQQPRSHSIGDGMPAITGQGAGGLAVPFITRVAHGEGRWGSPVHDLSESLPTLTASKDFAFAVPFLNTYYGNGGCSRVDCPVPTLTTRERVSLSVCEFCGMAPEVAANSDAARQLLATMRDLGVSDIGFRMLSNPELSAAQGFPDSYVFHGNKSDVTRQIGNSVSPNVAAGLIRAIAAA